jgi:hypothetical protein
LPFIDAPSSDSISVLAPPSAATPFLHSPTHRRMMVMQPSMKATAIAMMMMMMMILINLNNHKNNDDSLLPTTPTKLESFYPQNTPVISLHQPVYPLNFAMN